MKKDFFWKTIGLAILAVGLLLSGCSGQTEKEQASEQTKVPSANSTPPMEDNLAFMATKNTTRVVGIDAEQISISTSRMIWPATTLGTKPNVVLLAPKDHWQAQLVAADLIHHPSDGPLLVSDQNNLSEEIMKELKRLSPQGAVDETQIITIDMGNQVNEELSKDYMVKSIQGEDAFELAHAIDAFYAEASGDLPQSVIVSTAEAPEYAVPAGSWISHMPEPLLFVKKEEIPEKTKEALQKRNGKAVIYLLGPDSVISKRIEEELGQYGKVTRISGADPVSNAIAFAKYKDPATQFGWGITQPGHGLVLANQDLLKEAIPAVAFAHRGKHGPLLLTEQGEAPETLSSYLQELKPLFKNEPTEGPYNHLYLIGNSDWISVDQQGNLDHLIEIEAESGAGHREMHHQTPAAPPEKEENKHDTSHMNH